MSTIRDELKSQLVGALQGASFPIATPEALLSAFPMGADTRCKAGDVEMTAGEAGRLLQPSDFPFMGAEQVAETILGRAGM